MFRRISEVSAEFIDCGSN